MKRVAAALRTLLLSAAVSAAGAGVNSAQSLFFDVTQIDLNVGGSQTLFLNAPTFPDVSIALADKEIDESGINRAV